MNTFGRREGGGRRTAERTQAPLPVIVTTVAGSKCTALIDISCAGARLSGRDLPPPGEDVQVRIETVRAFGTIVWSDEEQCGVAFDAPLAPFEVDRLRTDGTAATLTNLSIAERIALEDWLVGAAH